jgi:uncharacterized protein YcfJ
MKMKKIQAAILTAALLVPSSAAFARTRRHYHHYSRMRGTAIGAVAGAVVDHKHPVKGAIIGGALGNVIQYERTKHSH